MTTFPQVLARLLAADPGRPLVTFYDDATGERTELSRATYATWVAKTAALLAEELDLEAGDRVVVDLPPHWLTTVVLGAAWTVGLEVAFDGEEQDGTPEAVVTGPDRLEHWAGHAGSIPVVASALLPLAGRFPDGVPGGVHDLGVEVWSQPDVYDPWPGPTDDTPAVTGRSQDELWRSAAAHEVADGGRWLSEADPASTQGLASLTGPLVGGGSLVLVVHATPDRLERIAAEERVSGRFDPSGPGGQSARS